MEVNQLIKSWQTLGLKNMSEDYVILTFCSSQNSIILFFPISYSYAYKHIRRLQQLQVMGEKIEAKAYTKSYLHFLRLRFHINYRYSQSRAYKRLGNPHLKN